MKSKIEPMKDIAKMLRRHKRLILNWFEMQGKISAGIVEGFNTKAKLTTRKAFGFRTYKVQRIALLHQPEEASGQIFHSYRIQYYQEVK